ncbi:MAG: methylenetetrahydrofolate reductase [NAD(P)H] [Gammaproteobacteria bacterium]|nr:methylenetetrahydrofolate reductase [NAD(P)H] [Gammaproteobacteria bacterium]
MISQKKHERVFSFEFFPPKTKDAALKLREVRNTLAQLNPRFFSVTFGAGGSTRDRTLETVLEIQHAGLQAAPHLSCIASSREELRTLLDAYRQHGIRHIVALRGDLPEEGGTPGDLPHASDLVAFIRAETGNHFHIEVAAYPEFHPEASNASVDLQHFQCKVEAGADSAMTQYFYNPDAYYRFVDSCEKLGITLPIVPGIMPITNYTQLARFSDRCGAEIPRWIRKRLEAFSDDAESLRAFGLDVVTELCHRLLEAGAPGLHFYTMNQATPVTAIWKNLNLGTKIPPGGSSLTLPA